MLGDYGFRQGISGKVAPSGPLVLDKGHWAAAALGHAWVFNQQTRVIDLVTGAKGSFATPPNASNRANTRWGPGYQLGAQGSADYIKTLVSAADCPQGNVAIVLGFSNYTVPPLGYAALAVREPQGTYTYGTAAPAWTVEADTAAIYWDNGNAGGEQTRATGPGGGVGVNAFLTGRDNLNIVAVTDNGTTAGTNTYINNGLLAQFSGSGSLQYGTGAAATDSIQFGNNWGAIAADYARCCLHFAYVFKRGLSHLEIASLSADPYQFWSSDNFQVQLFGITAADATLPLTGTAGAGAAGALSTQSSLVLPYSPGVGRVGAVNPNPGVSLGPISGATGAVGGLGVALLVMGGNAATAAAGILAPQSVRTLAGNPATGIIGSPFPSHAASPSGAAATASLGSLTTTTALTIATAPTTAAVGTLQAQGSIAVYTFGIAGVAASGVLSPALGAGITLGASPGAGTAADVLPALAPTLFGTGGTGGPGRLTLSGVVGDSNPLLFGVGASGESGGLVADAQAVLQPQGAMGRAVVGTLAPSLPGVWTKTRPKAGFWTKEF